MPPRRSARGAQDIYMQYIRGQVTESGNSAFSQVTVALPVVISQGFVIQMHEVEFNAPAVTAADLIATDDFTTHGLQLTKSSQTAQIDIDDPNFIAGYLFDRQTIDLQTAEKSPVLEVPRHGALKQVFTMPILLPFEQIYFNVKQANVTATSTLRFRLGYTSIKLSSRQIVEIVQAIT